MRLIEALFYFGLTEREFAAQKKVIRIDYDEVRLDTVSENGYTLYSASRNMYFNTTLFPPINSGSAEQVDSVRVM